jgi:plastocyanin
VRIDTEDRQVNTEVVNNAVWKVVVLFMVYVTAIFGTAGAAVHHITVENFRFDADDNNETQVDTLMISMQDTVQWDWIEGFHTITSGLSSDPGDDPGALFDVSINSGSPVFQYVFMDEGDVPYFCRPHEGLNMKGMIRVQSIIGIDDPAQSEAKLPSAFSLSQNYPNPFNPITTITFQVTQSADAPGGENGFHLVSLEVYNLRGKRVRTLVRGILPPGQRTVVWNGRDDHGEELGSGVYLYRLTVDGRSLSRRMVLAR